MRGKPLRFDSIEVLVVVLIPKVIHNTFLLWQRDGIDWLVYTVCRFLNSCN